MGDANAGEVTRWEGTAALRVFALEAGAWALLALGVVALRDHVVSLLAGAGPLVGGFVERNWDEVGLIVAGIATTVGVSRIARVLWRAVGARTNRYSLSTRHLRVESGFFSKSIREINLRAVDDILIQRSLLGRLVGVGEIAVVGFEADGRTPRTRLRLPGVADPLAVHALIREAVHQAGRADHAARG